jgi:NO-binding membrane sensor protein with MHYT domain
LIFISVLASYAALDLAGRVTAARGRVAAIPVMQIKDSQPIKSIGFAVPAL